MQIFSANKAEAVVLSEQMSKVPLSSCAKSGYALENSNGRVIFSYLDICISVQFEINIKNHCIDNGDAFLGDYGGWKKRLLFAVEK